MFYQPSASISGFHRWETGDTAACCRAFICTQCSPLFSRPTGCLERWCLSTTFQSAACVWQDGGALTAPIPSLPVWLLLISQRRFGGALQQHANVIHHRVTLNIMTWPPEWNISGLVFRYRLLWWLGRDLGGKCFLFYFICFKNEGTVGFLEERRNISNGR